jgi:hypothetical protein
MVHEMLKTFPRGPVELQVPPFGRDDKLKGGVSSEHWLVGSRERGSAVLRSPGIKRADAHPTIPTLWSRPGNNLATPLRGGCAPEPET